jgi:hypothetical protein
MKQDDPATPCRCVRASRAARRCQSGRRRRRGTRCTRCRLDGHTRTWNWSPPNPDTCPRRPPTASPTTCRCVWVLFVSTRTQRRLLLRAGLLRQAQESGQVFDALVQTLDPRSVLYPAASRRHSWWATGERHHPHHDRRGAIDWIRYRGNWTPRSRRGRILSSTRMDAWSSSFL